jgi:hypothetical protein
LNRSVIESIHDAHSPINTYRSILDSRNLDLLDTSATEPDFTRFDTDLDGFVNGSDVKEPLMASGLPQQLLAKMWTLVDTSRSGRLNLAQFTLLWVFFTLNCLYLNFRIQFVKECRNGVVLPDFLPQHLLGWISAANTPVNLRERV